MPPIVFLLDIFPFCFCGAREACEGEDCPQDCPGDAPSARARAGCGAARARGWAGPCPPASPAAAPPPGSTAAPPGSAAPPPPAPPRPCRCTGDACDPAGGELLEGEGDLEAEGEDCTEDLGFDAVTFLALFTLFFLLILLWYSS